MPQFRSNALIAVGSNKAFAKSDVRESLIEAFDLILKRGGSITAKSRFFRTPAFPAGAGPDFVNAAISVEWDGTADALLTFLHEIEAAFGRERRTRWAERTLDLDVIAFGDIVLPDLQTYRRWRDAPLDQQMTTAPEQMILPHPRVQDRAFVLVPLKDIAPNWIHPVTGQTIDALLDELPQAEKDSVIPLVNSEDRA